MYSYMYIYIYTYTYIYIYICIYIYIYTYIYYCCFLCKQHCIYGMFIFTTINMFDFVVYIYIYTLYTYIYIFSGGYETLIEIEHRVYLKNTLRPGAFSLHWIVFSHVSWVLERCGCASGHEGYHRIPWRPCVFVLRFTLWCLPAVCLLLLASLLLG